jgi:hypothetical protein
MASPKFQTIKQFRAERGVGHTLTYQLIGTGKIKAVKLGAKTLIDVESADAFFLSLPVWTAKGPPRKSKASQPMAAAMDKPASLSSTKREQDALRGEIPGQRRPLGGRPGR